ncbi:MAG: helix-turn-helix domain-containing protein [Prevotellaceae bacterium]|jgi:transposase-like protein|nr:helix-turn-helix domain-containing protein [Prevotellaceae bacterium]
MGKTKSANKYRSRLTEEDKIRIPALVADGRTYAEIGKMFGFDATTIFRAHARIKAAAEKENRQNAEAKCIVIDDIVELLIARIYKVTDRCNNPLALSAALKNLIEIRSELKTEKGADTSKWISELYKSINK